MKKISEQQYQELLRASHVFLETMHPHELAKEICSSAIRILNCTEAHLYLVEGEGFLLQEAGNILGVSLEAEEIGENLLGEDGKIVTPDLNVALDTVMQAGPSVSTGALMSFFPSQFVVATSLKHKQHSLGVLVLIDSDSQRSFTVGEELLLEELALFASQALSIEHIIGERESRDGLTGLYNQKYFKKAAEREIERIRRYGGELSLVMLDIDFFKDVNDNHGHLVGDDVLKGVAHFLTETTRLTDVTARYGGEEFGVLLAHTPLKAACAYAERLRKRVAEAKFCPLTVTISGGVTELNADSLTVETDALTLIKAADDALYRAKDTGRDKVVCKSLPG